MKTDRQKEKDKLDKLCSGYIRRRDFLRFGGCARTEANHQTVFTSYKQLQWAHCFGRKALIVRWDEDNGAGLCGGCHMYLDAHHREKEAFFKKLLGDDAFRNLEIRAEWNVGQKKTDVAWLTIYFKKLIAEIE